MKRTGLLAIITRVALLSFLFIKFGVDIATYYGVFLIAIDILQIKMSVKEAK